MDYGQGLMDKVVGGMKGAINFEVNDTNIFLLGCLICTILYVFIMSRGDGV